MNKYTTTAQKMKIWEIRKLEVRLFDAIDKLNTCQTDHESSEINRQIDVLQSQYTKICL